MGWVGKAESGGLGPGEGGGGGLRWGAHEGSSQFPQPNRTLKAPHSPLTWSSETGMGMGSEQGVRAGGSWHEKVGELHREWRRPTRRRFVGWPPSLKGCDNES